MSRFLQSAILAESVINTILWDGSQNSLSWSEVKANQHSAMKGFKTEWHI